MDTFYSYGDHYCAKWLPENNAEVLALFKSLRVTPRRVEQYTTIKGEQRISGTITSAAHSKLLRSGKCAAETLLD